MDDRFDEDTGAPGGAGGGAWGDRWLAGLPAELAAQRRLLEHLLAFARTTEVVTSLSVGCSLGRGAADALSDVDAAIGVAVPPGAGGAEPLLALEEALVASLPEVGTLVGVLRQRVGPGDGFVRRLFAQFADGVQLDVALMAEVEVRRGRAAPDFVSLHPAPGHEPAPALRARADATGAVPPVVRAFPPADEVSAEQVHEWAWLGWCALADADKYLRRGSWWEVHHRLHQARGHVWALWAAARGALYPWHGLSQVLDHDPGDLPPGIEATVAGLDPRDLHRAACRSAEVLQAVSALAATRWRATLPEAMAGYVSRRLSAAAGVRATAAVNEREHRD